MLCTCMNCPSETTAQMAAKDIRELNHDEVAAMYRLGLDHIYISGGAVDCRCGAIPR